MIVVLTVVYFIAASINTLDMRLIQANRAGTISPDDPMLPSWAFAATIIMWGSWLVLLFLNWKYALILFVIKFVLKVLPVLETVGNVLMAPFRPLTDELDSFYSDISTTPPQGEIPFHMWLQDQTEDLNLDDALELYTTEYDLLKPSHPDEPIEITRIVARLEALEEFMDEYSPDVREDLERYVFSLRDSLKAHEWRREAQRKMEALDEKITAMEKQQESDSEET